MTRQPVPICLIPTVCGLLLCLCAACTRADLVFTLTPTMVTAAPGQTVTFSGLLTDTGTDPLYLNTDFGIVDSPLTLDDSPFFNTFVMPTPQPTLPADNIAHTYDLFSVSLPSDPALYTGPGPFAGSFTLYGGLTPGDTADLGTQTFTISLGGNAVPESGAGVYVFALITTRVLVLWLRRHTRRM